MPAHARPPGRFPFDKPPAPVYNRPCPYRSAPVPSLKVKTGPTRGQHLALKPGPNSLGRHPDNLFPFPDLSVSSFHCELVVEGAQVRVRDLDSTNGTFLNGQRVRETLLQPGQLLQIGNIQLLCFDDSLSIPAPEPPPPAPPPPPVPPPVPAAAPVVAIPDCAATRPLPPPDVSVCQNHPAAPATYSCVKCRKSFCPECIHEVRFAGRTNKFCPVCGGILTPYVGETMRLPRAVADGFFAALPGAFAYPFRKDGLILLTGGAAFFALLDWLAAHTFIFGIVLGLVSTAYLFACMQRIVQSSAQGEDQMPEWPDLTDFWQDIVTPFCQYLGTLALCFTPALGALVLGQPLVAGVLASLGAVYLPMGLLTVAMADSIAGINPVNVVLSILKVPLEYLVTLIVMAVVLVVGYFVEAVLSAVPIPIVIPLLISFASLFFITVLMRLLGLLYYTNRDRLQWF